MEILRKMDGDINADGDGELRVEIFGDTIEESIDLS